MKMKLEDMFDIPGEAENALQWFAPEVVFPDALATGLGRLAAGEHLYIVYANGCTQKATVIEQRDGTAKIQLGPPMARCPADAPRMFAVQDAQGKIVGFSLEGEHRV